MPALPEHVAALRLDLHPILAGLYHALHAPDGLRGEAVTGGVSSRLTEYRTALTGVYDALVALKERVIDLPSCSEAGRRVVTARLASAADELIRVYGAVLTLLAERPTEDRCLRLERNMRANLERITQFLADILGSVAEPARILLEGRPDGGTGRVIQYTLRLPYPEDLAELDSWADTPTGYDAGHVREALAIGRGGAALSMAARAAAPPPAARPAPRRSSAGGWLLPLVVGLLLGDWLSDDDPDDSV